VPEVVRGVENREQTAEYAQRLRQKRFHAEATAAGFFELGSFDDHGAESLLVKNRFQLWGDAGRDIAVVDHDSVCHKAMGLVGGEQVDSLPQFVQRGQSVAGEGSGENES